MLNEVIAQKLAKGIMKQLGYNINIMNEKGIIIASGDSKRIGDFHEIAYKVIKDKLSIEIVQSDEQYIGAKPGVNMPIFYDNRIIGVVGITGNPESIMDFAHLVRMSVETMVEYELFKQQLQTRQNTKNVLLFALLYEEPINPGKIKSLAEELGYKEKIARIPIIIKLDPSDDIATIQENIKNAEGHSKQDISLIMGDNHILVFKTLPGDSIINYKDTVKDYIKNIDNKLKSKGNTPGNYYVGTPQHEFELYRQGFHHANWMEMNKSKANSDALFFMDFISDYFRDSLPFDIFDNIFSSYLKVLDQFGESVFVETAGALLENNMNIINTSQKLFLHRNTVTFRLNKIKDILGIDPVNSMSDREFLSHMLYFINNK